MNVIAISRTRLLKLGGLSAVAVTLASGPAWVSCHRATSLYAESPPGTQGLGLLLLSLSTCVAFGVFGVLLYSIATAPKQTQAHRHSATAEVLWALVPILIVCAAVTPSVRSMLARTSGPNVVSYQCELNGQR